MAHQHKTAMYVVSGKKEPTVQYCRGLFFADSTLIPTFVEIPWDA